MTKPDLSALLAEAFARSDLDPLDDQEIIDAIDDLEGRCVPLSRSLGDCGDVGRKLHRALIELQVRRGSKKIIDV